MRSGMQILEMYDPHEVRGLVRSAQAIGRGHVVRGRWLCRMPFGRPA